MIVTVVEVAPTATSLIAAAAIVIAVTAAVGVGGAADVTVIAIASFWTTNIRTFGTYRLYPPRTYCGHYRPTDFPLHCSLLNYFLEQAPDF